MTMFLRAVLVAAGLGAFVAMGVAAGISDAHSASAQGRASWYGSAHHGRKTANGERFNMNAMTAAHKTLPFGTKVRVTNVRNGRSVVVRINDRGPYVHGRVIDVSKAAAGRLGLIASGTAPVRLQILN